MIINYLMVINDYQRAYGFIWLLVVMIVIDGESLMNISNQLWIMVNSG